jgi:AcrR family transcriptional regulator
MQELINNISIKVPEQVFAKDPTSSELGKQILSEGLSMIADMGLENFTFKKLALQLKTTESAIYRYFENKHKLLLYYANWYWGWLEYHLVFSTVNIEHPDERLKKAIATLVKIPENDHHELFNLKHLKNVIMSEAKKAYHTKEVDEENQAGAFIGFKRLCKRFSGYLQEVNPDYPYATSLSSLILEGVHDHDFFSAHLPSLTDFKENDEGKKQFYTDLVFKSLKK